MTGIWKSTKPNVLSATFVPQPPPLPSLFLCLTHQIHIEKSTRLNARSFATCPPNRSIFHIVKTVITGAHKRIINHIKVIVLKGHIVGYQSDTTLRFNGSCNFINGLHNSTKTRRFTFFKPLCASYMPNFIKFPYSACKYHLGQGGLGLLIYYSTTTHSVIRRVMAPLSKSVRSGHHSKGCGLLVKTRTLGLNQMNPPLTARRPG